MLNIIFAGTPVFSAVILDALIHSDYGIKAVYTQPDRPAGRGQKLTQSPVKTLALQHHLPVYQPVSLRDAHEQETLSAIHADIMIVVAFGLLLPKPILDAPRLGCINIHPSLLPRFRGAAPIQRAILAGDKKTGITIMQMEETLDTGPMLYRVACAIEENDTTQTLHDRLAKLGAATLLTTLNQLDTLQPELQNNRLATYAHKISKEEARIDWLLTAEELDRQIRAFNPWPVSYTFLNDKIVRIWESMIIQNDIANHPGKIIQSTREGIDVVTGKNVLRTLKMQLPGGRSLPVADVLNAHYSDFAPGQFFGKKNESSALAAITINQVMLGHSLMEVLPEVQKKCSDPRDQALIQAMVYGICRWFYRLEYCMNSLLKKPFKKKDYDIYALLLVGLYQLIDMRIPDHAAVSETVAALNDLKKNWAKQFVNAILRQFIRKRDEIIEKANHHLNTLYSYPDWIIKKLQTAWPSDWQAILIAGNTHPPFSLRVNQKQVTREAYLSQLPNDFDAIAIPETNSGIQLKTPVDVNQLPGFMNGEISVQDGAAQLAIPLLLLSANQRVLDACAAPGGKTAHMLEKEPTLDVTALDWDAKRLESVQENLTRLKLSASCRVADVTDFSDDEGFDRILLDAPCSASGVIRRHPDIKLLRRETDLPRLADTQFRLLESLWKSLNPGGLLLYTTCSIFPEENVQVIDRFLVKYPEVKEEKILETWGKECTIGRQILPGMHGMDGFYFARLRK